MLEELVALGCRLSEQHDALLTKRRSRRLRARRFLLDDQPSHAGPAQGQVDRRPASAHGRGRSSIERRKAACRKLRDVADRRCDRLRRRRHPRRCPSSSERDRHGFAFMTNEISSERRVEVGVAQHRRDDARGQGTTAGGSRVVAGPGGGAHRRRRRIFRISSATATWTCCWPATRSPSTTWSRRSSARRSASISNTGQGDRGRPSPSHARHQHDLPRRRAASRRSSRAC